MKIGLISYPMLFQRTGGLQVQILETARALQEREHDVELIDPVRKQLSAFDVVHVFSVLNGNFRILETARDQGVPTVLSPLLREHWTRGFARKSRFLDSLVGRTSNWLLRTQYRDVAESIEAADALVALGEAEKAAITGSFDVAADSVHVVPNGIPPRFFSADPGVFPARFGIEPGYVLNVASLSPHKNQMAIARALLGTDIRLVLVGPCALADLGYREALLAFPHVTHVGSLSYDDPALPSAYANAAAFCLPSASEVMPLSAMEALAAGTPVVMTNRHGMSGDFHCEGLDFVAPDDTETLRRLLLARVGGFTKSTDCIELAGRYSWHTVAESLLEVYRIVLRPPQNSRAGKTMTLTQGARARDQLPVRTDQEGGSAGSAVCEGAATPPPLQERAASLPPRYNGRHSCVQSRPPHIAGA